MVSGCRRGTGRHAAFHRRAALRKASSPFILKARNGDMFVRLIHTRELNGGDLFDCPTELQRRGGDVARDPSRWMPWNYRATLQEAGRSGGRSRIGI